MKQYHYFVSFCYDGTPCMCECGISKKISSYEDIVLILDSIRKDFPFADIVILNYILIKNKKY